MADLKQLALAGTSLDVPTSLNDLSDVSAPSPSNGQALVYDATAAVWRNRSVSSGGGSDMPIYVELPKSASDSTPSGLAMLAWPNGMRYVYCTGTPSISDATTGFIPPEYMGNGSVHIIDKQQTIISSSKNTYLSNITLGQIGNTVIGDSTSGATVTFERGISRTATDNSPTYLHPQKTSILFFVNPA